MVGVHPSRRRLGLMELSLLSPITTRKPRNWCAQRQGIIISIPIEIQTLCSGLEHFNLGAALGHLIDDTLIFANPSFRDRLGLTDDVLSTVRLHHLLLLDQPYSTMAMG